MVKQELIDRSPVRFFEKVLNGGVKAGEIGVLASKKGLGKTSVLVQIGLDALMHDKEVVHVSFNQQTSYVMSWYEDIFEEMSKKKNLDGFGDIKSELIRKRIVLNFNQDTVTTDHIIQTINALCTGGIKVEHLIIDGLDFSKRKPEGFVSMKKFAAGAGIAVWYSCDANSGDLQSMMNPDILKEIDTVIYLESKPDSIHLNVLKSHGEPVKESNLKLDPKTLLIADK